MATLYKVTGEIEQVKPAGKYFTLAELYHHVCPDDDDPIVQAVPVGDEVLWCHEEGKLRGLPLNLNANDKYVHFLMTGDYLVGNILVTSQEEVD